MAFQKEYKGSIGRKKKEHKNSISESIFLNRISVLFLLLFFQWPHLSLSSHTGGCIQVTPDLKFSEKTLRAVLTHKKKKKKRKKKKKKQQAS